MCRTRPSSRSRSGGSFTYRIQFPDPGLYWYHPHIREDYTQEMGLYGNIIVEPAEPGYWPPAHRDVVLTLDDVLLEDGKIATFSAASRPATPPWAGTATCCSSVARPTWR